MVKFGKHTTLMLLTLVMPHSHAQGGHFVG